MNQGFSVTVEPIVVDQNNKVIRKYDKQCNLITDWGLDQLRVAFVSNMTNYAVIGTGTTPTNRGSGAAALSMSASTTLTSDIAFFESDDALFNRVIQLTTGLVARIETFVSTTEVTISEISTFVGAGAVIWNIERDLMDSQYDRSTVKNTSDLSYNGSEVSEIDVNGSNYINVNCFRTIQFDLLEDKTITEAGWTHSTIPIPNLFGRIVFETPLTLVTNDRLLLKITINRKIFNDVETNDPIYNTNATWSSTLTSQLDWLSYINDTGVTVASGDNTCGWYEPFEASIPLVYLMDEGGTKSNMTVSLIEENPGAFSKTFYYEDTNTNFPDLRSISWGQYQNNSYMMRLTYDVVQDKNDERRLEITHKVSWDRVLPPIV